jgi:phage tail-like protein
MANKNQDPYRLYNFKLEINGITEGHFTECSGLDIKIETITYREAGSKTGLRHIPGPVDFGSVTLKYGLTNSTKLWDWMVKGANGDVQRRNVSIVMLDSTGTTELMRWNLYDAWPCEWHGSPLNAAEKGIALESLVITYDNVDRQQ